MYNILGIDCNSLGASTIWQILLKEKITEQPVKKPIPLCALRICNAVGDWRETQAKSLDYTFIGPTAVLIKLI